MTMTHDEGKPSLEELAHHGVKGMKWGTHKRVSTADIKGARRRLGAIDRKGKAAEDRTVLAKTPEGRAKAQKEFEALQKEFKDSPDRATATRLTRGNKAALLLLGGPLGVVAIAGNAAVVKGIERGQKKRAQQK